MPKPRSGAVFELGGQWIARVNGRPNWYRHWTDPGTGITNRRSLGTDDLNDAKRKLAEIVVKGSSKNGGSLLAAVLLDYFERHTDRLPSKKQSRNAGRIVLACWGNAIKVNQLTEAKQKEFAQWCLSRGFTMSYAARNLTVVKAALSRAGISLPFKIISSESILRQRWSMPAIASTRRAHIPTDAELAMFFRSDMPESLRRWAVIALMTAARPTAAQELRPDARSKATGLLNLNPQGRAQNRKYRALVRCPRVLNVFLNRMDDGFNANFCGYTTIEGVKSALQRVLAKNPELPPLSTYSFRHKAATVLRAARVPEDQIALQLGHRRRDLRMTAGYGEFDPDYLKDASRALDKWALKVRRMVMNPHRTRTAVNSGISRAA